MLTALTVSLIGQQLTQSIYHLSMYRWRNICLTKVDVFHIPVSLGRKSPSLLISYRELTRFSRDGIIIRFCTNYQEQTAASSYAVNRRVIIIINTINKSTVFVLQIKICNHLSIVGNKYCVNKVFSNAAPTTFQYYFYY